MTAQSKQEGLGFNGGELLLLAIGGCYCNDLFREAAKRGITIKSVHVDVEADWGGEPVRAQNVTLAPRVEAEASEAEILTLIEDTDRLAEIPQFAQAGDTCNPQRCSSCSSSKVRAAGKLMTVSV